MINAFFYGMVLALGLIVPLGVQNIFVLNQGASQASFRHALPSALTAFICDFILILSAVLGVSVFVTAMPVVEKIIIVLGIVFLTSMGWVIWRGKMEEQSSFQALSAKAQIIFAASVSLLNPHALLDTIAVIGTNSLQFTLEEKYAFTIGCTMVSLLWFLLLSFTGHYIKKSNALGSILFYLNKISALIMWGIAAYLAYSLGLK